jgi:hypothetical protein
VTIVHSFSLTREVETRVSFDYKADATGLFLGTTHIERPNRVAQTTISSPIQFKGGPDPATDHWPSPRISEVKLDTDTPKDCRCDVRGSTGGYYKGTLADWFEALDHCLPYRAIKALAKRIPNMIIADARPPRSRKAPKGSRQHIITPYILQATSRRPSNTGKRPDLGVMYKPPPSPRWEGDLLNISPTGINGERYVLLCVDRQGQRNTHMVGSRIGFSSNETHIHLVARFGNV